MTPDTRHTLIDSAIHLVRQRGYSAFSYADLAAVVGIRKASIHHHFPAKEDLGEAMVAAYREAFARRLDDIDGETADPIARLEGYAASYREGLPRGEACLCGVLASEIAVLPERVQAEVRRFFALNLSWLEQTLAADGLRRGLQPAREARTVLSALQGAMFVALSTGEAQIFDDALAGLLAGLRRH